MKKEEDFQSDPNQLVFKIQEELKIPSLVYDRLIRTLESYNNLKSKLWQSNKMNNFKDEMFEKVVSLFQQKESKTLRKLKNLQEINLKYIQRYLQTRKMSSSRLSQSVGNRSFDRQTSSNLNGNYPINRYKGLNRSVQLSQSQIIREDIKQITQSIQSEDSESIFTSPEWSELIKNAEIQINLIEQQQYKDQNIEDRKSNTEQNLLFDSFFNCMSQLIYVQNSQGKFTNKYVNQVETLIQQKKKEIAENINLKSHAYLNDHLKRLKKLLQKALIFEKSLQQIKQNKNIIKGKDLLMISFEMVSEKIEIQNLLKVENNTKNQGYQNATQQFLQTQNNDLFNLLAQKLIKITESSENNQISSKKVIEGLIQKKQSFQKSIKTNLLSLNQYVKKLHQQKEKDIEMIAKLQSQNAKLTKEMRKLQALKQKYLLSIETKNDSLNLSQFQSVLADQRSQLNESKSIINKQRISRLIDRQYQQQRNKLINTIIKQKDQELKFQKQKNKKMAQQMQNLENRMKSCLKERKIDVQKGSSLQSLFQIFQQVIHQEHQQQNKNTKENQQKNIKQENRFNPKQNYQNETTSLNYDEQRIIRLLEEKYTKALEIQREQLEENIEELKSELRHVQLQRDSYRNSLAQQQKQLTKSKQSNQRLNNKKNELEMQSCKTQEMLKSILQLIFAYLMANISYGSLVQQLEHIVENIKHCLRYREREKDKEIKQQQFIDYRFSGLSAVSNDYSFSKLNKESYCDYFNEDSSIQQESEVISKISEEDQLPPSRPSFSNNPKRTLIDINQRATMAHEDESLLGYLNPVQVRTSRPQYERTTVLFEGLNDESIRILESNLQNLRNRIPQQQVQLQKQIDSDSRQMYKKYRQALDSLQQSQKINKQNELKYQNFLNQLKEQGALDSNESIQRRLYFMQKKIQEQQQLLQQQRVEYETTITQHVLQSEKVMQNMLRNMNRSLMSQSTNKMTNK